MFNLSKVSLIVLKVFVIDKNLKFNYSSNAILSDFSVEINIPANDVLNDSGIVLSNSNIKCSTSVK